MVKRSKQQKLIYYTNPRFYEKVITELKETEEKVALLLKMDIRSRNDDTRLITEYWRKINGIRALILPLRSEQRVLMTAAETITRTRRKLAEFARKNINECPDLDYLLPIDEEVIEKRNIKEAAIRDWAITGG